jgi:Rhodopirellula transposase DDE domain
MKELVGNFKNNGRAWRPKGDPEAVNVQRFIDPKLSRAVPYGVCDIKTTSDGSASAAGVKGFGTSKIVEREIRISHKPDVAVCRFELS